MGLWRLGLGRLGGVATPASAELEGAGHYAMGAGMYNLNTAQARSINAQTAMQWNDYVAQVTHESARIHAVRVNSEFRRNQRLYDAYQQRLRDNPGKVEIEDGSALNVALDDLSNPKLGSSALRAAKAPVSASLIAEVPFMNNAERVTLMLDNLRGAVKWPDVFEGERFAKDKETFDELVAQIRKEAQEADEISPKTLRDANVFVNNLRAKVTAQPLADPLDQQEADKFLTTCSNLLGLLAKPDIQPAILELKKVQDTTIGNLLGFMHAFNLRFGRRDHAQAEAGLPAALRGPRPDARPDPVRGQARRHGHRQCLAGPRVPVLPEPGPGTPSASIAPPPSPGTPNRLIGGQAPRSFLRGTASRLRDSTESRKSMPRGPHDLSIHAGRASHRDRERRTRIPQRDPPDEPHRLRPAAALHGDGGRHRRRPGQRAGPRRGCRSTSSPT